MAVRRQRRGRRTWPQRLLLLMNSILAVACLGAAALFGFIREKASQLPTVSIDEVARTQTPTDGPRNFLLVGTDSSDALPDGTPIKRGRDEGQNLADVIMVLRVDPTEETASLLSIPRDTWVPVAPNWSKTKINSAFGGNNGSNDLIATIKHNFGISIDHFAQVDFAGFQQLVQVLGGIPTYNTMPIRDPKTGLFLPQTGCILVDPAQSLAYARSRHMEYQDNDVYDKSYRWRQDPTSDLGRITRQQDFIRQAAQRAIDEGIRNPTTAYGLINAGLEAVTVDGQMDVQLLLDLISTFRDFPVDELQSEQLPTEGNSADIERGQVSYQKVLWDQAEGLLDIYRGIREPGEVVPQDVIVGLAPDDESSGPLHEALDAVGFDAGTDDSTVESSSSRGAVETTTIRFGLRGVEAARVLAGHLDGEVEFEFSTTLPGRRLELLVADVAPTVRAEPVPLDEIPEPTIPQTKAGRGTTTTTSTPTTMSSVTSTVPSGDADTELDDSGADDSDANGSADPVESGQTTPRLDESIPTTTTVGIVPLDASKAAQCRG